MSNPSTQPWRDPEEYEEEKEMASNLEHYHFILYLNQLEDRLRKAGNAARIVEECRQIIDQACKNHPNGLPF